MGTTRAQTYMWWPGRGRVVPQPSTLGPRGYRHYLLGAIGIPRDELMTNQWPIDEAWHSTALKKDPT